LNKKINENGTENKKIEKVFNFQDWENATPNRVKLVNTNLIRVLRLLSQQPLNPKTQQGLADMVKDSENDWSGQYFRNIINGNESAEQNLKNKNTPLNRGLIERRLYGNSVIYLITIEGLKQLWDYDNLDSTEINPYE